MTIVSLTMINNILDALFLSITIKLRGRCIGRLCGASKWHVIVIESGDVGPMVFFGNIAGMRVCEGGAHTYVAFLGLSNCPSP